MRFERLGQHNFEPFRVLAEHAWRRATSEAYYRWRYFEAPGLTTLLAMDGERCIGTISYFERTYRAGESTLACIEPFDWFALPEARRTAAGLRLMKQLQKLGQPILGCGGSEDTIAILPKLGFRPVGEACQFVLPLTGTYLLRNAALPKLVRRGLAGVLNTAASTWFTPAALKGARALECSRVPRIDPALAAMAGPAGFASIPDPAYFDWLERGAGIGGATGRYIPVEIREGGKTAAWGIGRLYRRGGVMNGTIVELRTARDDAGLAEGAIRAITRVLARSGADNVRVWSALPLWSDAYRAAGFRTTSARAQAMVWTPQASLEIGSHNLCAIADAAFFPAHDVQSAAENTAPNGVPAQPKFT